MGARGFKRMFGWLRGDTARQVHEELDSHIAMKAEELVGRGVDPVEARRRAHASFGDPTAIGDECRRIQEELHGRRRWTDALDATAQDVRFAVRGLRRSPGFSTVAIITLALGIGANTAIFSVANGLLLRALPGIEQPERLLEITQGAGGDFVAMSYPVYDAVRQTSRTLDDIAAFDIVSMAIGDGDSPEVFFGLQVSGNYFEVLGVEPAAGRFFAPEASFLPTVEDALVISHSLWMSHFNGDDTVVGREIVVNGYPARIAGVAAPGFGGHLVALKADLFVPLGMQAPQMHGLESLRGNRNGVLEALGRMADGAGIEAVREEIASIAESFIQAEEGAGASYPLEATPYGAVPGSARPAATLFFLVLMTILGMLLLITCVNLANMMLSRADARQREIAVRMSMGAGRGRLLRQMLTESLVLAALAALCGTVLAIWLTRLLMAFELPVTPIPGMRLGFDFGLDSRVLMFVTLLVAVATTAFGLVPALRATRPDLVPALKDSSGGSGLKRSRMRGLLVGGQMAFTVLLLLGSGLFLRALQTAHTVDTGFETADVWVAGFDLELNGYEDARTEAFYSELLAGVTAIPGVETAALAGKLPLAGASSTAISVVGVNTGGFTADDGSTLFSLHNQIVSSDYFQTLRLDLVRGRTFGAADTTAAPMVAVINRTMAERFWTIDDALGKRFILFGELEVEVVGVVADAKYHSLTEEAPLFAYFDYRQRPRTDMFLHVRVRPGGDPALLMTSIPTIVERLDAAVPVLNTASLDDALQVFLLPQLFAAWITGVAGFFGLLLGGVGIYGVCSHAVSRRGHEIGVRIALGAGAAQVRGMMLRQGLLAPAVGMSVGLVAALAATRVMGSFLVGVSPLDPLAFGTVLGLLGGAAVVAALVPARRAARVDPIVTLRAD